MVFMEALQHACAGIEKWVYEDWKSVDMTGYLIFGKMVVSGTVPNRPFRMLARVG
jgi:hypothetical protein